MVAYLLFTNNPWTAQLFSFSFLFYFFVDIFTKVRNYYLSATKNEKEKKKITPWHLVIDPIFERADTCKHRKGFSRAHVISPTNSSPQNPLPALITHKRPSTVSLATTSLVCLTTSSTNHGGFVYWAQYAINFRASLVTLHRKHRLLQNVGHRSTSYGSPPAWIQFQNEITGRLGMLWNCF